MTLLKKFRYELTALGIALVILGGMLLPGYILSLDMVFTPFNQYTPESAGGFLNSSPLWYVVHLLYFVLPGYVVEKGMLFVLFFLLSFVSLKFLPLGGKASKRFKVRLFASLLYTANPFVYERLLAGHWAHLFAYALLPLVLHFLFSFTRKPTMRRGIELGATLALVGLFSLHLFVMSVLASGLWFAIAAVRGKFTEDTGVTGDTSQKLQVTGDAKSSGSNSLGTFLLSTFVFVLTLCVLTSYWTIPAFSRVSPVEKTFNAAHWQAFAAAPHGALPTLINLSAMGGYWGEAYAWAHYFRWPQENILFWFAYIAVMLLAAFGVYVMWNRKGRTRAIFFVVLSALALVLAAGVSATPMASFNYWLYVHVPFWSGFRDSQKFIALYALAVAVVAGNGFGALLRRLKAHNQNFARYFAAGALLVPLFFGVYMWNGFSNQLRPAHFPPEWYQARAEILKDPTARVLVLPWQGYLSLGFNHNLIVANPAGQFFGSQAVVSQNVRVGNVYDENTNASYADLDRAIRHNSPANGQAMANYLTSQHIQYIIFFQDIASVDSLSYSFLHTVGVTLEWSTKEVQFYTIDQAK